MDAGALDRKIGLLTPTEAVNDWGETIPSAWTVTATVSAAKQSLRLADHNVAQAHSMVAEAKFLIRWRTDVTNNMRVRFNDTDYEIISIEEIGRKEGLTLLVRRG